jgi:hypothetical protein
MTEWGVVTVLAALVSFAAVVVGPMLKLNTSITKLTVSLTDLRERLEEIDSGNTSSHRRLWDKNDEQDRKLEDHEMRLHDLESGRKDEKD